MAVEFTALGGDRAGQRVRLAHNDRQFLDWYATKYLPAECNARVMARTVTCGDWEDV